MDFSPFEKIIGYKFNNIAYLKNALCHSSYANEHHLGHMGCNERLEFLGDAVLGVITAEMLYQKFPDKPEGELTKIRAAYVCESALCNYARELHFGDYLLLGRGEDISGGRSRPSILADAFEAVLAAMYLDSDMEQVKKFLLPIIARHDVTDSGIDYKTALQEFVQRKPGEEISYVLTGESGPDHDKLFTVSVSLNDKELGSGSGHTKKEAEQMAAKQALHIMKNQNRA